MTTPREARSGAEMIWNERKRQVDDRQGEGFDESRDDAYTSDQLALAAACYALPAAERCPADFSGVPALWPLSWNHREWWKPGDGSEEGRIRELVKAGALIAAEIDRRLRIVDRTAASPPSPKILMETRIREIVRDELSRSGPVNFARGEPEVRTLRAHWPLVCSACGSGIQTGAEYVLRIRAGDLSARPYCSPACEEDAL